MIFCMEIKPLVSKLISNLRGMNKKYIFHDGQMKAG